MKKIIAWIIQFLNVRPLPFPVLTYEGVAIKFIKTVGIERELHLSEAIKFDNGCWIWRVAVTPDGMIWLSDASQEWFELDMLDREVPRVLEQLYPVLLHLQETQLKTA